MALTEPYDTAIIDIMLPKLDGLVAYRKNAERENPHAGHHPECQRID